MRYEHNTSTTALTTTAKVNAIYTDANIINVEFLSVLSGMTNPLSDFSEPQQTQVFITNYLRLSVDNATALMKALQYAVYLNSAYMANAVALSDGECDHADQELLDRVNDGNTYTDVFAQ
jgi:hypothetical protein